MAIPAIAVNFMIKRKLWNCDLRVLGFVIGGVLPESSTRSLETCSLICPTVNRMHTGFPDG